MQAPPLWTPPTGTLGQLVAEARLRVDALRARERDLGLAAAAAPGQPPLSVALRRADVAVIAEVKRRSPSKGWISQGMSAPSQAASYAAGGAAAISVLTEPDHFAGSPADLVAVRAAVGIPVLKKDFHIHPVQLLEARALGASAALLIARALSPSLLAEMLQFAADLKLDTVVEVRDERELDLALTLQAPIVGINNRNLETLEIDARTSQKLLRDVPADRLAIAESGVSSRLDVERAGTAGADAVLVGSSISAAPDPTAAVRDLTGVTRESRAA